MRRAWLFIALFAFILGCPKGGDVATTGTPKPTKATRGSATPRPLVLGTRRGVLVLSAQKGHLLSWEGERWVFTEELKFDDEVIYAAGADDTSLWIATNQKIRGYDNQFQQFSVAQRFVPDENPRAEAAPRRPPFRRNVALDVQGSEAYVSEGSQFHIVSPANVTSINLKLPKTAHDVLVYGDEVFLVDDIMRPLWIHRVDVSNKTRPRPVDSVEIRLVNGHLGTQWINPSRNEWYVTTVSNRRGLVEATLHVTPLGKEGASDQLLWRVDRRNKTSEGIWAPYSQLWRVTHSDPPWGLMKTEATMSVVRLGDDKHPATIAAHWDVPGTVPEQVATGLALAGDRLFVAVEQRLYVLLIADGEIQLEETLKLPELPVDLVAW